MPRNLANFPPQLRGIKIPETRQITAKTNLTPAFAFA